MVLLVLVMKYLVHLESEAVVKRQKYFIGKLWLN